MPNVYLSEDYLIRLISQAVAALHIIIGLRAAQQYKEAQQKVDEALEGQLGLRASLLKELDDERLKEMLATNGRLEMERFLLVADLFHQSAELAQIRGDELGWRRDGQRALNFYQEALQNGGEAVDEALPGKIKALKATLGGEGKTVKEEKSAASAETRGGSSANRGIKRRDVK
jgi:hypothetical protein